MNPRLALFSFCVASAITPIFGSVSAYALGSESGNGGDFCEDRIKVIRDDLISWLGNGGARGLNLPPGVTEEHYQSAILGELITAHIACTSDTIQVMGDQKTCKNFVDSHNVPQILCDSNLFLKADQSAQYVLAHHEFAGLAGFELTTREGSNYEISNQLSSFLQDQVIKKLSIKSRPVLKEAPPACDLDEGNRPALVAEALQLEVSQLFADDLKSKGVEVAKLDIHVKPGTFEGTDYIISGAIATTSGQSLEVQYDEEDSWHFRGAGLTIADSWSVDGSATNPRCVLYPSNADYNSKGELQANPEFYQAVNAATGKVVSKILITPVKIYDMGQ